MGYKEYDHYPYNPDSEYLEKISVNSYSIEVSANLNERLSQTKGPALEVGGPTKHGFKILEGVEFPNKLIISNILPENEDIANIDIMDLPYDNESLGCIIASCLPISPLGEDCDNGIDSANIIINLFANDISNFRYDKLCDKEFIKISPRIALIAEASRTLERDGLLFTKHLLQSELNIIKDLGFDLLYFIKLSDYEQQCNWKRGEYVFQLKNRDCLAGIFAVKSYFSSSKDID